jgi:hypothetical protein
MTGRVLSMTPEEFAFTLTVPREAGFVPIVRDVAAQVVTYSAMDATNGKAFVDSVAAAGDRAFAPGRRGTPCHVRFACEHGEVHVTLDGETIRQRVAS